MPKTRWSWEQVLQAWRSCKGKMSSVQMRGATSVGLCMVQDGASADGRAVSAQEGTAHGSAGKRERLGISNA